jgi:ubiquinone/menaquinone biosynthesis C-methylase UbiE
MNSIITIIIIVLGIFIIWQIFIRFLRRFFNFPAPAFIGHLLDSDYRRRIQPPSKLINRSGIKEGMKVLEVGCGSGAFTTFVARAVGKEGEVFALDIQREMLKQLEKKLSKKKNQDIMNIQLIEGDAHNLPFDDDSFDLVYTVTVLQEIPDKNKALHEIKRVLKPGGILAVTELLPDPDYPLKSTTIKMGTHAGFVLDTVEGGLWNYTARFIKPSKN